MAWTNRDKIPDAAQSMLVSVGASVQELASPLPIEPVGVGAIWDVTHAGEIMGIRYAQTTTYELVSLEGSRGEVRLSIAQTAPSQKLHGPSYPGGNATLETWYCHGKGEAVFDLDRLVSAPFSVELSVDASQTMTIPERKEPIKQAFHVDVKMEVDRK